MRKKLFCLLLSIAMVLSFAACGDEKGDANTAGDSGKNDFDSFMEVQQNMKDIKDMEFKMNMDAAVTGQGSEDSTIKMSGAGKEVVKSQDDVQMEMKYNMTIPGLGSGLEGTMYMKDKALYMDLMGQKVKMDASNEMAAIMNIDTDNLLSISQDMISDLKVSQNGDDTVYTFDLDAEKALAYFQKNAGSSQQLASTEGMTFDKMKVKVVAGKDQMAKSIDMDCSMTTKVDEKSTKMDYKITMEYVSINTDLKIDFPDFSGYQELSV